MSFWCLQFFQKGKERYLVYHSNQACSFFGRIEDTKDISSNTSIILESNDALLLVDTSDSFKKITTKGQIFSKYLCYLQFFQKTNKPNYYGIPSTFPSLFGRIEDTKKTFRNQLTFIFILIFLKESLVSTKSNASLLSNIIASFEIWQAKNACSFYLLL